MALVSGSPNAAASPCACVCTKSHPPLGTKPHDLPKPCSDCGTAPRWTLADAILGGTTSYCADCHVKNGHPGRVSIHLDAIATLADDAGYTPEALRRLIGHQ